MDYIDAIVLGLVQGLTEFLPVSSSGHLVIGKTLLGIETGDLSFEIVVHAATVLSTMVVFYKDIFSLISGVFRFRMNEETEYVLKIAVSMIPVFIVGVFFKDYVESIFGAGLPVVGVMLIVTSLLLYLSEHINEHIKTKASDIGYKQAFIVGIAQACAVLPGLSRSGSTIATGLLLGIDKSKIAKFSFLMVLVPILGEAFLELLGGDFSSAAGVGAGQLAAGGAAAFISGLLACKLMINIVRKAKLWIFSIYCLCVGIASIVFPLI